MFRHERPQKGRFRQFHQIDAEIIGDPGPRSDADVIIMAMYLLEAVGLGKLTLALNSLGCPSCRPQFKEVLENFLTKGTDSLCADCQRRAVTNPLRVFDCKVEGCKQVVSDAPSVLQFTCKSCQEHFEDVQSYIKEAGIPIVINHKLVRGLDYYTRTTFEIQTERLGAQNAVVGGGRYDDLAKQLGGPDHPAIGFAMGMERVVTLLEENGPAQNQRPDLFVAALGQGAEKTSFNWVLGLRRSGCWVESEFGTKGLKAQMKKADRLNAKWVLIVGDDELASGKAVIRDMDTKDQEEVDLGNIENAVKRIMAR
jgi:histidyl-tRNA synthetase